jgi:hypothetical protein
VKIFDHLLIVCLLLWSTAAFSDLYSDVGTHVGSNFSNQASCVQESLTGAPVSVTNCAAAAGTFSGTGTADYSAGLHASSQLVLNNETAPTPYVYAAGYGRVIDTLNLTNIAPTDVISLIFHLDGNWTGRNMSIVRPVFSFGFDYGVDGSTATGIAQWIGASGTGTADFLWQTPYYSASDFELDPIFYSLSAQAIRNVGSNITATGTVNFDACLVGVSVLDSDGAPVSGAVVTSVGMASNGGSGQLPNVPEPSSLMLLASGFAGMIGFVRRKVVL